jgi:hypothetical protein
MSSITDVKKTSIIDAVLNTMFDHDTFSTEELNTVPPPNHVPFTVKSLTLRNEAGLVTIIAVSAAVPPPINVTWSNSVFNIPPASSINPNESSK